MVQKLLRKARQGTKVYYVIGNHDEFSRRFAPTNSGRVEIVDQVIHEAIDGKKYLVIHGDQFDGVLRHAKWLSVLGALAYDLSLKLNRYLNYVRRKLGKDYWSLSKYLKFKVKNAVKFIPGSHAGAWEPACRLG